MNAPSAGLTVSQALFSSQTFLEGLRQQAGTALVLGQEGIEIRELAENGAAASLVADRVWRSLLVDFGLSVPGCRVVAGETVEFHVSAHEFAVFDPIDMPYVLTWIDGLFEGSLRLIERDGENLILRFPPLTRFEAGARLAFGPEAANWYYVPGEIERGEAIEGHARRKQHIALSLQPVYLEQAGCKVHPAVYAVHDVNHAVDVAGIHPELLKIAVTLGSALMALPAEFQSQEFVQDQLEDLSELLRVRELTLGNFLKRAFLPWEHEVRGVYYRIIPSHERARRIDLGRRYLDLVFDRWLPLLSEDRRSSVGGYRDVLRSLAEDRFRNP